MLHQLMKIQNERKRLCGHLTQVQAEKNMWDFNVIYVTAIHLRGVFVSVNSTSVTLRSPSRPRILVQRDSWGGGVVVGSPICRE